MAVPYPTFTDEELKSEEWCPVYGYESRYEVSTLGRVRRFRSWGRFKAGSFATGTISSCGYRIIMTPGSKLKQVHNMVADTFICPRPSHLNVNHIDGDKLNNRLENLEYLTQKENVRHAFRIGPVDSPKGQRHACARFTDVQVTEIRREYDAGLVTIRQLEARYRVDYTTIRTMVRRITWRHIA